MQQPGENPIKEAEAIVQGDRAAQIGGERQGRPALYTCPDCGGTLWQVPEPELLHFRCHVGHIVAAEYLFARQLDDAENALWMAIRLLEDRRVLGHHLAEAARDAKDDAAAVRFDSESQKAEARANLLRAAAESG
jgi:two-component system, chemotaxis family, protein-glutamate methylesterase/glutaminase